MFDDGPQVLDEAVGQVSYGFEPETVLAVAPFDGQLPLLNHAVDIE